VKAEDEFLRMGILSKMFQASLKISNFDEAYLTLMQYTNKSLYVSFLASRILKPFILTMGTGNSTL